MSIGWVAGSARARAMTGRRLGREAARAVAESPSLPTALRVLAQGPYGREIGAADTLADAQRAVVRVALWHVRVLAGWVPREGVATLRVLTGALEAVNVVDHVRRLGGSPPIPALDLGALATSWPRVAAAGSADEVRRVLATSPWGDPLTVAPDELAVTLRVSLADRVMAAVPDAAAWAAGATALLVARCLAQGVPLPQGALEPAVRVLGPAALQATSTQELSRVVSTSAAWALEGVTGAQDLWRAEGRWWSRVDHDGARLARRAVAGRAVVVGAVGMLAADAWRTRAALEVAARGPAALEVFDEVA